MPTTLRGSAVGRVIFILVIGFFVGLCSANAAIAKDLNPPEWLLGDWNSESGKTQVTFKGKTARITFWTDDMAQVHSFDLRTLKVREVKSKGSYLLSQTSGSNVKTFHFVLRPDKSVDYFITKVFGKLTDEDPHQTLHLKSSADIW